LSTSDDYRSASNAAMPTFERKAGREGHFKLVITMRFYGTKLAKNLDSPLSVAHEMLILQIAFR
jgi:hypothetical protein